MFSCRIGDFCAAMIHLSKMGLEPMSPSAVFRRRGWERSLFLILL